MEVPKTDSNRKLSVSDLPHIKYYINSTKHEPSKWEYLEYYHKSHNFWGGFDIYIGKHARDKIMGEFPRGNKTA